MVLPMLYNDVVQQTCDPGTGICVDSPTTWVTSKQFYAGGCLGLVCRWVARVGVWGWFVGGWQGRRYYLLPSRAVFDCTVSVWICL